MKNKYILFASLISLMLIFFSCDEDFWEKTIIPESPWNSPDEFENAAVAAYGRAIHNDNHATLMQRIYKEMMADYRGGPSFTPITVFWRNNNAGAYQGVLNMHRGLDDLWNRMYSAIATANEGMSFYEENGNDPFGQPAVDKANSVDRVYAELHFVRAYTYFELATTFAPPFDPATAETEIALPLRTVFSKSIEDAKRPKIGTVADIYNQIVEDLKYAKANLPEDYIAGKHHVSYSVRANKYVVSAVLAKVYFQMGEYDLAISECDFLINSGRYPLVGEPIDAWIQKTGQHSSVIFQLPFNESYDYRNKAPYSFSWLNHSWNNGMITNGSGSDFNLDFFLSREYLDILDWVVDSNEPQMEMTNIANRDKRFTQLMFHRPVDYPHSREEMKPVSHVVAYKYFRLPEPNAKVLNLPVYRIQDYYLLRSILKFKAGDKQAAANDLNAVRKFYWDTDVEPYYDISSSEITEEMIHKERLIEMYGEGDRIDYLKGLKMEIPAGEARGGGTDPYNSVLFYWGIPAFEVQYNEALIELGYKRPYQD